MTLLIVYCCVAIIFSFICSILESVFLSTSQSFVESYEKNHPKVGGYLRYLKSNVEEAEGAILVLNTFAVTACSTGFGIEITRLYGEEWQFIASTIFAIAMIYITEIFPKTLGTTYWRAFAPSVAVCVRYLLKITFPFVVLAKGITHFLTRGAKVAISRGEILAASEIGNKGGSLGAKETNIVKNLLTLKNYQAVDILTPRSVVFSLKSDEKIKDAIKHKRITHHSFVPVLGESVDSIVGVVDSKEILALSLQGEDDKEVGEFAKPANIVPHNISVLKLLHLFTNNDSTKQNTKDSYKSDDEANTKLFVVLDRYEQFMGIVTFEDVLETLLGDEIVDEFDEARDMQELAKRQNLIKEKHKKQRAQEKDEKSKKEAKKIKEIKISQKKWWNIWG